MQVRFKLFGFTDMLGDNELAIEAADGSSIQDCLEQLVMKLGDDFKERVLRPGGQLHGHIRLVMEGRIVDRLEEKIPNDATVFILHEIAGGGAASGC